MVTWEAFTSQPLIAYFSMEIGLAEEIPTYSGGLGVLAGDTIKSAADLKVPMVAVTLVSRHGYFRQSIDAQGWQHAEALKWQPEKFMTLLPHKVTVTIEGRQVEVQAWLYRVASPAGGQVPVLFLDTDIEDNSEADRSITDQLYGGDLTYRLKQEIVLGLGGARMLDALGFTIRKYHMNEGHASLLTLELLNRYRPALDNNQDAPSSWDAIPVMEQCVFTTHTPVEAGHDRFSYDMVDRILGEPVPRSMLRELGGKGMLNMTLLAINLSRYVNGVAKKHGEVSRALFPGFEIHAITNGIHPFTWASPYFLNLYDRYLPSWANEPEILMRVDLVPDEELWEAHCGAKAYLFQYIQEKTGVALDPDLLTIGFARRAAAYKRGDLILSDLERLLEIGEGKLQLVFAGKAHPRDLPGKRVIQRICQHIEKLRGRIKVVYLENYSIDIASRLIPGVDLWLNTPVRPLEASGTSGMKAALNGVPNFSVLDGWWIEGHIEGVTGWSIGPAPTELTVDEADGEKDLPDLYRKLEEVIIPLFYNDRNGWIKVMKNAIGKNASYFNTHVMMRRYVTEAYLP